MTTTDPHPVTAAGDRRDASLRETSAAIPAGTGTRQATDAARQPELHQDFPAAGRADPAARLAFGDVTRIIAIQYAAGVGLDQIRDHHQDVSARLLSEARTPAGRAYAREYAHTAATLVADLRADADAANREKPPPGTPHPSRPGWQTCPCDHGVYVRSQPEPGLEAG